MNYAAIAYHALDYVLKVHHHHLSLTSPFNQTAAPDDALLAQAYALAHGDKISENIPEQLTPLLATINLTSEETAKTTDYRYPTSILTAENLFPSKQASTTESPP